VVHYGSGLDRGSSSFEAVVVLSLASCPQKASLSSSVSAEMVHYYNTEVRPCMNDPALKKEAHTKVHVRVTQIISELTSKKAFIFSTFIRKNVKKKIKKKPPRNAISFFVCFVFLFAGFHDLEYP
jgi:hypothetical protein